MKTWKKVVRLLVLVAIMVPLVALVAIQVPAVQTALVGKVTKMLDRNMDGSINVGKVYFSFPNNVILKDIDIIQGQNDTLLHASKLLLKVKTSSLLGENARIRRISLEDGHASIRRLDDSTTNLSLLLAPFMKGEGGSLPWQDISLDKLSVKNFDFSFNNRLPGEEQPETPSGHIDWKNIALRDIDLTARDIKYNGNLSVRLDDINFSEQNGLQLERLGGHVALDGEGLHIENLEYRDGWSELHSEKFSLGFNEFSDFNDLFGKVSVDAAVSNSLVDLRTVYYFSGIEGLKDNKLALKLDGELAGPFNDLGSNLLRVQSQSKQTSVTVKARLRGLPDMDKTRVEVQIFDGKTNTSDLAGLLSEAGIKFDSRSIRRYAPGETISFKGNVEGPVSNLTADLGVSTATMGSVAMKAELRNRKSGMQLDGQAVTNELNLGKILGIQALGSLTADAEVGISTGKGSTSIEIPGIRIGNFSFNGYDYHDIIATGRMDGRQVAADIVSNDPNLQLKMHGNIDLGGKGRNNRYDIDMILDTVDLSALHFEKREGVTASMRLSAGLVQTPKGDILGEATIGSLRARVQDESFDVGDILFNSTLDGDTYGLTLNSSFAKADYYGNLFITDYIKQAVHLATDGHLNDLTGKGTPYEYDPDGYGSIILRTVDMAPVCSFFAPNLFVSRESSITLSMLGSYLEGTIGSELVAAGNLFVRNTQGRIFTEGDLIKLDVDVDRIETGALAVEHLTLDAAADSTVVDLTAGFTNTNGSNNQAEINTRISFAGSDPDQDQWKVKAEILPSSLTLADLNWELSPSVISYREKHFVFEEFEISHGKQSLEIDGIVGEHPDDTVRIWLDDFDVSIINAFTQKNLDIKGQLTGQGEGIALLGQQKGLILDLAGREFEMVGRPVGELRVKSNWDDSDKMFHFLVNNRLEERTPLRASASYRPSDKNTDINLQFDRLSLGYLEPLMDFLVSDVDGSLSGKLHASGPLSKLELKSENARFNDLKFKLLYTQVDYIADGPFTVASDGVSFDDISVKDKYGHTAILTGGVPYDHFKNLRLNVRLDLQNVLALNTKSSDNDSFYGRAFADGSVRINGPLDGIRLNLNLTTKDNSTIHIPLGASAKESNSLLTFINNEEKKLDLYDSLVLAHQVTKEKKAESSGSGLSVNLRLNATPDAEVQIEINRNTGDILKARGNGNIGILVGGGTSFDIKGDYRVESGNYHFGMLGITSRDFSIDPGGTIGFTGDVMQSNLNLTATYRTKASISPLIADSTAVSTRRNVECGIAITGKLANPEIGFKINVPDLDPTTQSRVESALNTEDKRMKQALALLISGGFVPDEQSGIVNSTTMLYSNASELMAGQINNIFRQLDIPLDLGFNYQPSETGKDIFDVAVSTQLFNNRVNINGNIGNRQYMSSSNSDIVGDLDIEIKLNRQGQVRLTLFSHSADQYSNYLDQSQRNGAGIVYQEDFNTVKELWRKIFHIKDNNERQAISDPNAPGRP